MRELAARHQVIAVEIIDPRSSTCPTSARPDEDPETGEVRELRHVTSPRRASATPPRRGCSASGPLARCGAVASAISCCVPTVTWVTDMARFALSHRRVALACTSRRTGVPR